VVTAKVRCDGKTVNGEGANRTTLLMFQPDYADGRNQEWAAATPHLSLQMTVRGEVGDRFEPGRSYTLQFVEGDAST
jgi:hypothetical protein